MSLSLNQFAENLKARLAMPLPGAEAHEPMRAVSVGPFRPVFNHLVPPKPGSVLILFFEEEGRIKFPLIKRSDYNGAHSGQISLPGGKAEPGETTIETALRENEEEIGVSRTLVNVIGSLSEFFVIPSNFLITPVVAYCDEKPVLRPDSFEVARIITADLGALLPSESILEKEILAANRYAMRAPHFEIEGEVVWGATAMMLNELRWVINELPKA